MAKFDSSLVFADGGYTIINGGLERLAADPVANLFEGRMYYNTASDRIRSYDGTVWIEYGSAVTGVYGGTSSTYAGLPAGGSNGDLAILDTDVVGTGTVANPQYQAGIYEKVAGVWTLRMSVPNDYITADSTNTLLNKSIDANGAGNSITNLEVADFAATAINATTNLASASDTQFPTALAVKTYADNLVTGLYDDRGNYDASVNTFPAAGGSGAAGAVAKGDIWRVTVAGTLGTDAVQVGDTVRALSDAPGQTATNWAIMQNNDQQATTTLVGNTRYATNAEALATTVTDAAITPSNLVGFAQIHEQQFGDGAALSYTIAHGRGSAMVTAEVYEVATGEKRFPNIVVNATNIVVSGYITAPTANQFKVVWVG